MVRMWKVVRLWIKEIVLFGRFGSARNEVYGVSRSVFGRLSIRFDGGPSYPEMVNDLEQSLLCYGYLIDNGTCFTGEEWIQRIVTSGADADMRKIHAIRTLMPAVMKAGGGA